MGQIYQRNEIYLLAYGSGDLSSSARDDDDFSKAVNEWESTVGSRCGECCVGY